jgi:hypothetical protein
MGAQESARCPCLEDLEEIEEALTKSEEWLAETPEGS